MTPRILCSDPATEFWFEEGCYVLEMLNDHQDPAISIARIRVPAGSTTRWHRLAGITERYVILEGKGRVEIGELAPRHVGPGDVVIIPPGMRQRIANTATVPGTATVSESAEGAGAAKAAEKSDLVFFAICSPRFTRDAYEYPDGF